MLFKKFVVFFSFIIATMCNESISQVIDYSQPISISVPVPMLEESIDPDLQGKVWNRWNTKNFTILSLDKTQGLYVFENVEKIKTWIFARWGLQDVDFSSECRILVVPNFEIMKKLFRVDGSRVESRKENGKIKMHVMWLVFDKNPTECMPSAMTMVCLSELEQQNDISLPFWVRRGISILNLSTPQIKSVFSYMHESILKKETFNKSEIIFRMTREEFIQLDTKSQRMYDSQAATLCLFFRKEFGQYNFLKFIFKSSNEKNLKSIIGFNSFNEFDQTFKRYMYYLSQDIVSGRVPKEYLEIARKD